MKLLAVQLVEPMAMFGRGELPTKPTAYPSSGWSSLLNFTFWPTLATIAEPTVNLIWLAEI
jgi:hypothetical protein